MVCGYCGRLSHRCACHLADSDIRQFLARGGRSYAPLLEERAPKRAVPPQIKRRERMTLRRHYRQWHRQLVADAGERCANCGAEDSLVLDHVIPIARGGRSTLDNLQMLCATCNRIKGALMIDCRSFTHSV
ncbi:MAG: HNH endonuclease signature motif containing protein [Chloroflexota bacterium]|nr:HNH endonuclease signature motif containing protein [Chloroflexota bacterium]